ncbi:BlaI/MecI/CopY family transcriptional regulator [Fontibacillus sp. BL9]|uniref:BlaI/MecI/CopY family transcriptional regulator n=1 Tax=Fontibacillus sp. BL9 TaxID=3389971 RepID=UPI00397C56ED
MVVIKHEVNITEAEHIVMEVIWGKNPISFPDILEAVKETESWSSTTVHTLLSRLVKKGAISVDKTTSKFLYAPLISFTEYRKQETDSFLKKMYKNSYKMFMANFIEEADLSRKEIEELQSLLDQYKDKNKKG